MRKSAVRAYDYFLANKGKDISPDELDKVLGVGKYSSRHVWILKNKLGMKIDTKKQGRNVTAYVLVSAPKETPEAVIKTKAKGVEKATKNVVVDVSEKAIKKADKKVAKNKAKKAKAGPKSKPVVEDVKPLVEEDAIDDSVFVDPDFDAVSAEEAAALIG